MAKIVASTYELLQHIGAGGGGNVYLAKHLRLDKLVVLKADKRKMNARPELLRREVDVLKDLTHSYIPKVYDFFVEDDTVYTVMDYIQGESLDKPLKRGERFSQAQVITWAKQLLEALAYLHSPTHGIPPKGYVHSDIKPANLMLKPDGSICLIDFNISLALGELNFIGCSAGYASPEHYGLDYSSGFTSLNRDPNTPTSEAPTEYQGGSSTPGSRRMILPDVRSDIFSTGATLYHLLSGKRPAQNALQVVPLSKTEFSPQLVDIITRAMNPNPDLRFQTAADMLWALEHLHENDPRVKKQRRSLILFESGMCALFLLGIFSSFTGLKRIQTAESFLKLTEYSRNALAEGNSDKAAEYALEALPQKTGLFTPAAPAAAEAALADALGAYDLSDGFRSRITAELGSEPLCLELSPDGKTLACIVSGQALLLDTQTAAQLASFPADVSALSEIHFIGSDEVVFAGENALTAYGISSGNELWTAEKATGISVSDDGSTVAAVYRDNGYALILDAKTGAERARVDFGGRKQSVTTNDIFVNPHDNLFSLSGDGSMLAISFSDGSLDVFLPDSGDLLQIFDNTSGYTHFEGGFFGKYFVVGGCGADGSLFAVIDCEDCVQTLGLELSDPISVSADRNGILLQTKNLLVSLDPETGEQTPLITQDENVLSYSRDGGFCAASTAGSQPGVTFYNSAARALSSIKTDTQQNLLAVAGGTAVTGSTDSGTLRILELSPHEEENLLTYDPDYAHDEARVSADGNTFMLFSINGFRIYGRDGSVVNETALPEPDTIYDQQFIKDGESSVLEVIYYSGKVLTYSAADGSLVSEETREKPDKSLEEEFLTDRLRIVSSLHGAAVAYDRATGKQVAELDGDAYLTYVTQLQDGRIIAQYVTTAGDFYGVMMNEKCQVLAKLPRLCDISDGMAVFDYSTGNMRKTRFYTTNELIRMAQPE